MQLLNKNYLRFSSYFVLLGTIQNMRKTAACRWCFWLQIQLFWVFPCFGSDEFKVGTEWIEEKRGGELLINGRQDAFCFKNSLFMAFVI